MKLTERLADSRRNDEVEERPVRAPAEADVRLVALKMRLHGQLIDKADLRAVTGPDVESLRARFRPSARSLVHQDADAARLAPAVQEQLVEQILDEVAGLGPLEGLFGDAEVTDIMVNAFDSVYVERKGRLEKTPVTFHNAEHLFNTIQRIVSRMGRRLDEASPMVDARLPDGSRINAAIPPASADGPILSIRRFRAGGLSLSDLRAGGAASREMVDYLSAAVRAKCNMLISGGTGAGKTTLLNALSALIPEGERVVTIEDSLELALQREHVVRMEARPPNIEGRGEITIRALVRNALRMRPDRIIIGEVRGAEVLDMLQAMNTGHEGSMTTIHANSSTDATDRLMMMLALSGVALTTGSMAQFISRSIRVVVQVLRQPSGARRITEIGEVVGLEAEKAAVRPVFSLVPDPDPHAPPRFKYHGGSTLFARFAAFGVDLPWAKKE